MSANKVILNGKVILDLTGDTVSESEVALGEIFHKPNGERAIGTAILPKDAITIKSNGEFDIRQFATAYVNVEDNPLPIEVSTEAEMNSKLTNGKLGAVYKYTGITTNTFESGALYIIAEEN